MILICYEKEKIAKMLQKICLIDLDRLKHYFNTSLN